MEWSNIEVVQPITGAGVTCLFMWMTWGQVPLFTLHSTGEAGHLWSNPGQEPHQHRINVTG